ncbi:Glycosyltransferase involved in cell wall bisynthesis [Micromonospora phaseoli]|uniref:Glycosyltransferase involved in cell wall bisynthesis n=1 Tax=Micromonospora phaseoli TaxID=1144548 RepID=A0A1H7DIJ9_9ACTN|nr:glycosyltransferase [Micromonospora phaseoli]PZW02372.1 glycosyltransferase involved in cell wall biosynthesis [Micromonospora phaseoli]GIJ75626.1 glucosyltransferase [Micromonospora phaseoli]SEK01619.1 Glycosyltransferase involved in cell wall bisynthesis [Micromonospora phaseoli]
MSGDRVAVIWRSCLLPGSETFIRNQGDALSTWRPVYLGAVRVTSALSRNSDVVLCPDTTRGRREWLRLRLTGGSPRLRRMLGRLRPEVVHAHFGGDGWLVSRAATQLGIPLIVTLHGLDVTRQAAVPGPRGARHRRNLRTMFDRAALILAVSEAIRERAVELGADPAKVRVHHTGVPVPPQPATGPKQWDVVFVGRFVEKKGADDLVEALGMLPDLRPRALLVGTGPLRERVRARAEQLGVDATFPGTLPPSEVMRHITEARLLAAPSRTASDGDTEGLPTTILEAFSLGVPVVSTYHSGIPEAVTHEANGLLCAEGDRAALAANLRRLLTDDLLRARLGRAARHRVETDFDLHQQTRHLESLYNSLPTLR